MKNKENGLKCLLNAHINSFLSLLENLHWSKGGIQDCCKDDKFWINFYAWKDAKYGARGPTQMDWDIIMAEEE